MKKFYEAPVVEMTGFSAEDVITTSAIEPGKINAADDMAGFKTAVAQQYQVTEANVQVYNW